MCILSSPNICIIILMYADLEEKVSSLENEIKEYQEREVATAAESKVIHTVHGI